MKPSEVAQLASVTENRLGTIAKELFGQVPTDYTDEQAAEVDAIAAFMRSEGIRSVKTAVSQYRQGEKAQAGQYTERVGSATQTQGGTVQERLGQMADNLSDELADALEAQTVMLTMQKFGRGTGKRSAAVWEVAEQAIMPTLDLDPTRGFLPPASSARLLNGSVGN